LNNRTSLKENDATRYSTETAIALGPATCIYKEKHLNINPLDPRDVISYMYL
jgi:hypothetical protein